MNWGSDDSFRSDHAEGFDDFMDEKVAKRSQLRGRAATPGLKGSTTLGLRGSTIFELKPEISDESRAPRPATGAAAPGVQRPAREAASAAAAHDPDGPAWGAHIVVDKKPYKIHTVTDFMGRQTHTYNTDDGKRWEALRNDMDGRFYAKPQQKK